MIDKNQEEQKIEERVIQIDRVSRTVKGGRRLRFRALVAIGDKNGKVAIGIGKANEVITAVSKATTKAKRNIIEVKISNGTIPHEINVSYGGAKIFLKPASAGTSIIAGGAVRSVLELAGVKNILSKILGSNNKINNAYATILALKSLKDRHSYTNQEVELRLNEKNISDKIYTDNKFKEDKTIKEKLDKNENNKKT